MQIFVKNNRTWVIDVEPTDTVLSVKQKIEDVDGIPVRFQSLNYAGRVMDDQHSLAEYGISVEATVNYYVRCVASAVQDTGK